MPPPDPAMEAFPLVPVAFSGAPRTVSPDAPFNWLGQGWAVFIANPGVWLAISVLLLVAFFGLLIVPGIGSLAAALLTPVLLAGLLHGVRRLGDEGRLDLADLFAGFRHNSGPLVMLGLLFMAGWMIVLLVVMVVAGGGIAGGVVVGLAGQPGMGAGIGIAGFFLAFVLKLLLGIPLCVALWFAPALIYFNDMAPLAALQASFSASLKNWLAMLVFGLLVAVLAFFALLPMGLGFLVLIPVLSGALYASYKDIFLG
ncbi:MAG TPA: BPSS1780 family membrane protein [Azospira sp.]|nr:BPSS1780 family membrane protein [Azospira sp.]